MKKLFAIISIVTALVTLLVMAVPVSAASTQVNVSVGGGTVPAVKCKWEQQPVSVNPNLEDGDSPHAVPGFQILPPVVKCKTKTIEYYAVVTDVEDGGNLSQAFADVYHPTGSPEPYGPSKVGGVQNLPYFKYEVPFVDLQAGGAITKAAAAVIVNSAYTKGLITFGNYTIADVLYELDKGTAHLWMGTAEIDYEQPAGNYDVLVYAVDTNNNLSPVLANQFTYVAVAGIEADFTGIDFGSVNLGVEKMIPGDLVWNTSPGLNNATVRNIGNTWASLTVKFDDMGFGKDVTGKDNVNFDARMGSDNTFYVGAILPNQTITLDNALKLSSLDELDLSIKILKGFGTHNGIVTMGSVIRPFTYDPAKVVGTPAPCAPGEKFSD
jgi:hypothetical protein